MKAASSREALLGSAVQRARVELPSVSVEIWDFDLFTSQIWVLREDDSYRLDLCLNARAPDARLRFSDRWASHRFEAPGKLFLLPPRETLHVKSGVGDQRVIICRLPKRQVGDWLDTDPDWNERRAGGSFNIASQVVTNLLLRLGEEAQNPGFGRNLVVEAMAVQLAVEIERYFRDVSAEAASGLPQWRLRAIEERLRDGPDVPSLTELASVCGLSVRQLSRSFRAARGVSIGAYVAQRRVEMAKDLLGRGEHVKAVAARTGFANPSSFGYAFRKATGQSPSEFRSRAHAARFGR